MSPVEPGQLGPGRVLLVLLTIALNVLGQQEQACAVDLNTSNVASMFLLDSVRITSDVA